MSLVESALRWVGAAASMAINTSRLRLGQEVASFLDYILEDTVPRVIHAPDGSPYLERYYLYGAPSMPDGSSPWDETGQPRPGAIWPSHPGVYLHRFWQSDPDDGWLHSHPWDWAFSVILAGGYVEERCRPYGAEPRLREFYPGSVNVITSKDYHRVQVFEDEPIWTLFVTFPWKDRSKRVWDFFNPATGEIQPWRVRRAEELSQLRR